MTVNELQDDDGDAVNPDTQAGTLTVEPDPDNTPPTADAGPDQTVTAGESLTLDGTASTDPDGDSLSYSWDGQYLADRESATPSFEAPDVDATRTYTATLTVTDGNGGTDTDQLVLAVTPNTTPSPATTTAPAVTTTAPSPTTTALPATTTTPINESGMDPDESVDGAPSSEDTESSLPLVPIGGGIGTLALLGGGIGLWKRRQNSSSDTSDWAGNGASDASGSPGTGGGGESIKETADDAPDAGADPAGPATVGAADATEPGGTTQLETDTTSLSYTDIDQHELIGSGGNADVYRGVIDGPHGPVDIAVKHPRVEETLTTSAVETVLSEAETWYKLDDHAHILDVLGWGAEPLPWIVMEYMDGGNLTGALPLQYDRGAEVLQSIASAVEHAHRMGIAHGDLKPANVLFAGDPETGTAKVGDWGLAQTLLEHSRSTEGLSPAYAAPEQFDGGTQATLGPQLTDIYQLGAVAYAVFTGRPPYEGTPFEMMNQVRSEQPPSPTSIDPSLPAATDEIIATAMAKDPTERYEAMVDLRRALEKL